MTERPITDILAEAFALGLEPPAGTPVEAGTATAPTLAAAHFRAECEQAPVTAGKVTVFPIGMRPAGRQ